MRGASAREEWFETSTVLLMKTSAFTNLFPIPSAARLRRGVCAGIVAACVAATVQPAAASGGTNQPPFVTITVPFDFKFFEPGTNVHVSANSGDIDGTVIRVDFYVDSALRFQDTIMPFAVTLEDITVGTHALWAVARDNSGLMSTSQVVTIFSSFPPNLTPIAPNGSVWRYSDSGANFGTEWRDLFFDDHLWRDVWPG